MWRARGARSPPSGWPLSVAAALPPVLRPGHWHGRETPPPSMAAPLTSQHSFSSSLVQQVASVPRLQMGTRDPGCMSTGLHACEKVMAWPALPPARSTASRCCPHSLYVHCAAVGIALPPSAGVCVLEPFWQNTHTHPPSLAGAVASTASSWGFTQWGGRKNAHAWSTCMYVYDGASYVVA